jgi:hypothetical protein
LFETTCTWAADSAIIMRDGLAQSVPYERIVDKIWGELGEVGIGSGGYVDLYLAESMLAPIGSYFMFGQYSMDFTAFNDRAGLAIGMMAGSAITGDTSSEDINETIRLINERRDDALHQKWFNTCLRAAYF